MSALGARVLATLARRSAAAGEGTLRLEGPGSGRRPQVSGTGLPDVTVRIRDDRAFDAVVRQGSVGLARGYSEEWWDSDDLTAVVRVAFRRTRGFRHVLDDAVAKGGSPLRTLARWHAPTRAQDRQNVAAHYDLSNEFFALMLDPTMAYSCACFEHGATDLESAQLAKFEHIAAKLDLASTDSVLEIGTGWGGLALYLAETRGCSVTTTTISEAQRTLTLERVATRGLSDRIRVLGADYRELVGTFDAIVSVEMIEAVDWRRHDEFFAVCDRLLAPDGRMALQAITIADRSFARASMHDDFVRRMIFPGGCLPSLASLTASLAKTSDLRLVDLEDIGASYPETLRCWRTNLAEHRAEVAAFGFDRRFWRLWEFYLCYCEAAFLERHVSDVQLVLARPRARWRREAADLDSHHAGRTNLHRSAPKDHGSVDHVLSPG